MSLFLELFHLVGFFVEIFLFGLAGYLLRAGNASGFIYSLLAGFGMAILVGKVIQIREMIKYGGENGSNKRKD